jgi:Uma2 family endonuclease
VKTVNLPPEKTRRLLTTADLAVLPTDLPSGDVRYELEAGELRTLPLHDDAHGGVAARIAGLLHKQGEECGHGQGRVGEVGIVLGQGPDTVVGADACFLTSDQLPARRSREGYLLTVPALVVEVVSKNDRSQKMKDRVKAYLAAGARAVWVADPRPRTVTVHRADQSPVVLRETDSLTAEGIIPELSYPVHRLFDGLM